jgi:hypothetical protein
MMTLATLFQTPVSASEKRYAEVVARDLAGTELPEYIFI